MAWREYNRRMNYRGPLLFTFTVATLAHGEKAPDDPMVPYDPRRQDHAIEWNVGSSGNAWGYFALDIEARTTASSSAIMSGFPSWPLTSGAPVTFRVDGRLFTVRLEINSRSA